jgi:kumamolisin
MAKHPLKGSERREMAGATQGGPADPNERLQVSVLLRRGDAAGLAEHMRRLHAGERIAHLSRVAFESRFGAHPDDIEAVRAFAAAHHLHVVHTYAGRRTIVLSGTVAQFGAAFGVSLHHYSYAGGSYRGRTGAIHLPDELHGRVDAVLGLDNRPVAHTHFRIRPAAAAGTPSYTPLQIAGFYDFPAGTGAGECVGIIELGGGETPSDLDTYLSGLGITRPPNVVAVPVDGASNAPTGDPSGPDGEVMLDVEMVAALAPQAKIVLYFAPNTDAGFIDAVTAAAHDSTNKPSVISISWGGPESTWTQQSTTALDAALQAAAAMGVTVCVACGDSGSSDGVSDGADHVDFPASSPHALACGGTTLNTKGSAITSETVWNDGAPGGATGGGQSTVFALPTWQDGLNITPTDGTATPLTNRGTPDVSGDADPQTGYNVLIDGTQTVIGGTSAVAPLWAALIARLNEANGTPLGLVNPALYANEAAFNDITQGNNGDFAAAVGWDACTGLGSPNATKLAAALKPAT